MSMIIINSTNHFELSRVDLFRVFLPLKKSEFCFRHGYRKLKNTHHMMLLCYYLEIKYDLGLYSNVTLSKVSLKYADYLFVFSMWERSFATTNLRQSQSDSQIL